jgi:hypothetical protein
VRSFNSPVLFSFTPGFSPVVSAPKSQGTVSTFSFGVMSSTHFPRARRSEKPLKTVLWFLNIPCDRAEARSEWEGDQTVEAKPRDESMFGL